MSTTRSHEDADRRDARRQGLRLAAGAAIIWVMPVGVLAQAKKLDRSAVQYVDQNGQQRNAYGNFDWHETDSTVTLQLLNPLGQTLALVTSAPSQATLELPNRQPLTADNVSTLMQQALGFALPIEGLRYWLQPSVAPSSHARTTADPQNSQRLSQIEQDGWTIDYVAYADAPANGVKRVNLTRDEPPLQIKLVLDQ